MEPIYQEIPAIPGAQSKTYKYKALDPGDIWLLELQPGSETDAQACHIVTSAY
jgi:hypothetical protein